MDKTQGSWDHDRQKLGSMFYSINIVSSTYVASRCRAEKDIRINYFVARILHLYLVSITVSCNAQIFE